jgi:hypothetical protein
MSKVTELKEKYSTITDNTFNRFVNGDKTPTKKYLEYFLKSWANRKTNHCPNSIDNLITLVDQFDGIITYIEKKDIYDPIYKDLMVLKNEIDKAVIVKDEKTFIRDEHCQVLVETDNFLFIRPTTHRGSLKYGANTKWCVASKKDPGTFKTYTNTGLLVYLIDKSNTKRIPGNKVAFYLRYSKSSFNERIELFNVYDGKINDEEILFDFGWSNEVIANIFQIYRTYHHFMSRFKDSRDYVKKVTDIIGNIDSNKLQLNIEVLSTGKDKFDIKPLISKIDDIHKKLTKLEYGFTEA